MLGIFLGTGSQTMAGMCAEPAYWMVRAGSAIVRREASTASELVCELERGRLLATVEEAVIGDKGTVRLRMVEPCDGWLSKKVLLPFEGVELGALDARKLLEVRRAGRKGDGVFALAPLREGLFLGEYEGELISLPEVDRRYPDGNNEFLYDVDGDRCIDATNSKHFSRWLNHSHGCYNLKTRTEYIPEGVPRIAIYASRDIDVGDELTFDYGNDFFTSENDEVIEDIYGRVAAKVRRQKETPVPGPTGDEQRGAFHEAMGRPGESAPPTLG